MQHSRELKIGQTIFYASLFLSLAGCTLLVWQESRGVAILSVVLILAIFTGQVFLRYLVGPEKLVGWSLTLATLNLFLVVPELALRVAGFRGEAGIQFGYPRPDDFVRLDPDERLFWKLRPANRVNSLGFPGDEIATPKPQGLYRVLFLGDSCTQQGYPDIVERFLNERDDSPSTRFESITLAVSGYSSHQGRVLAEMYGEPLEPDLVVVYFGWNDHWQAYQAIDSQKVVREPPPSLWTRSLDFTQRSRLLQGLQSFSASLRGANEPIAEVRVPKAQYRENLSTIQKIFERRSVPVVFISAPTSHYQLGVPDYLVELDFVPDKESSVSMHRSYNQVVREVAGATGSYLLDLERNFDTREDLDTIFTLDGIHFTSDGLALVAKRVSDFLEEVVSVPN